MKRSPTFGTDNHTHAGRQHLIEMMIRHRSRLHDIADGKREKASGRELYSGMNTTLTLDNATPRSYRRVGRSSGGAMGGEGVGGSSEGAKRAQRWSAELEVHRAVLAKMMSRIAAYPTPTERRANRFDPVAHPVQFKRTTDGGEEKGRGRRSRKGSSALSSTSTSALPPQVKALVERDILYSTGATRSQRYYVADPFSARLKPRGEYNSALLTTQQMQQHRNGGQRRPHTVNTSAPSTEPPASARVARRTPAQVDGGAGRRPPQLQRPTTSLPSRRWPSHEEPDSAASLSPSSSSSSLSSFSSTSPSSPLYRRFRATVQHLLLSHRLHRPRSVDELMEKAMEVNSHLDRRRMEAECDDIRDEWRIRTHSEQRGGGDEDEDDEDSEEEEEGEEGEEEDEAEAESREEEAGSPTARLSAGAEQRLPSATVASRPPSESQQSTVSSFSAPSDGPLSAASADSAVDGREQWKDEEQEDEWEGSDQYSQSGDDDEDLLSPSTVPTLLAASLPSVEEETEDAQPTGRAEGTGRAAEAEGQEEDELYDEDFA